MYYYRCTGHEMYCTIVVQAMKYITFVVKAMKYITIGVQAMIYMIIVVQAMKYITIVVQDDKLHVYRTIDHIRQRNFSYRQSSREKKMEEKLPLNSN